jgi:lipid A ethanolaminephosphotransferase
MNSSPSSTRRLLAWRPALSSDALLLLVSLFFALACNRLFLQGALVGRDALQPANWGYIAALLVMLVSAHLLLIAPFVHRVFAKPLLALLIVVTAFATYYMQRFTVFLDPSMLRNVLRTDVKEAKELFSPSLLPHLLLFGVLPLIVLWRVRLQPRPWLRALLWRVGLWFAALVALVAALLSVFQDFSALMRNQRELRYLITPANYLYSLGDVLAADLREAAGPRQPIGLDAKPGPSLAQHAGRPMVFVLVVGETARAASWGLNGYARQTTPELAKLPLVSFAKTTSCGTNTEVSLPCMFAPIGRRDYNERRIRDSQSLLHVLQRAGLQVQWRDNQSGCKGVCEGLPLLQFDPRSDAALCDGERCLDEILLKGLDKAIVDQNGPMFIVLHQLGNHGPAYFKRYPPELRRFMPTCDTRLCTREQIVNSYDNALLATDRFLARTIALLQRLSATHDTALLYVSDHGESLGENNLFLHGLPYSIAPREQTEVPMLMWSSDGFAQRRGLDMACMARRAREPASHDHLFHSLLGLLDVKTSLYEPSLDFAAECMNHSSKTP